MNEFEIVIKVNTRTVIKKILQDEWLKQLYLQELDKFNKIFIASLIKLWYSTVEEMNNIRQDIAKEEWIVIVDL